MNAYKYDNYYKRQTKKDNDEKRVKKKNERKKRKRMLLTLDITKLVPLITAFRPLEYHLIEYTLALFPPASGRRSPGDYYEWRLLAVNSFRPYESPD